jgi:hypothetical protein
LSEPSPSASTLEFAAHREARSSRCCPVKSCLESPSASIVIPWRGSPPRRPYAEHGRYSDKRMNFGKYQFAATGCGLLKACTFLKINNVRADASGLCASVASCEHARLVLGSGAEHVRTQKFRVSETGIRGRCASLHAFVSNSLSSSINLIDAYQIVRRAVCAEVRSRASE